MFYKITHLVASGEPSAKASLQEGTIRFPKATWEIFRDRERTGGKERQGDRRERERRGRGREGGREGERKRERGRERGRRRDGAIGPK